MRKWISIAALILSLSSAQADTPPARAINAETYDAAGNAITSTVNGAKRGLDTYNVNPASAPVNTQIIWSGSPIDPRQVNAIQAGTWTINSHTQDSGGANITSTISGGHTGLDVNVITTSPVSGIVTANQGTPNVYTAPWFVELSDGARVANITAAHALTVDGSAVVQPVSQSGTWNINALQSGVWSVGRTWTLSSGTDSVSAVQSGDWSTRTLDGTGTGITSTLISGGHQALDVNAVGIGTTTITDLTSTGSITTTCATPTSACPAGSFIALPISGVSAAQVEVSGTFTGASLNVDGTVDGTTWVALLTTTGPAGAYTQNSFSTVAKYRVYRVAALTQLRVRASALTSGSVAIKINASNGTSIAEPVQTNPANLNSTSWTADGSGNYITSQVSGAQRALDVGIDVAGVQVDPRTRTWNLSSGADSIASVQSGTWTVQQGGTWTVQQGSPPWSVSQSGTWNINNVSGTVSLPTNAAQETGGHLASVDSKLGTLGQKTMAGSAPVVIASDQSAIPASQSGSWTVAATQSGAWAVGQSGSWTVTANAGTGTFTTSDLADGSVGAGTAGTKSILAGVIFNTVLPTLTNGQQAALQADSSGRLLVGSIASALPTGSNTIGSVNQAGAPWSENITQIGGSALALGQATMASSVPVVIASNQSAVSVAQNGTWTTGRTWTLSSGTDSVAATQSGSWTVGQSGAWIVKAQLQDNAGTGITLGQKTMANSVPVVISSDQAAVPASQSGSWTVTANAGTGTFTTSDLADGSVGAGTAGTRSLLGGAVFNTSLPTLTNGQQAALQSDSSGRLIIRPLLSATDTVNAVQSGTWTVAQGTAASLSGYWPVRVTDGTNTMPTMDVVGRAGFQKITDGTNTAAVKAASTAAVATDPALVVAISPNNTVAVTQSGTWTTARSWTLSSGTDSVTAVQSGTWAQNLTQVGGSSVTLGQKTMANSIPTAKASDQTQDVGRNTFANFRNVNSTTNITTSAFVTAVTSTSKQINTFDYYDTSGQEMLVCYAATCGALASGQTCKYLPGYGSGNTDWNVPSGQCIGVEAVSANATVGVTVFNFNN